ncbi:MAG TPA: hypothetical protein VF230_01460 [Acidimicrobiales bacterium]
MAADDPRAELSSLSTMLDHVTARLSAIAEATADDEGPIAPELFEIERDLITASRRLTKLLGDLS